MNVLPLGIPQGGLVLTLSKKSKSYCRAGGNVNATWHVTFCDTITNKQAIKQHWCQYFCHMIVVVDDVHYIKPKQKISRNFPSNFLPLLQTLPLLAVSSWWKLNQEQNLKRVRVRLEVNVKSSEEQSTLWEKREHLLEHSLWEHSSEKKEFITNFFNALE